MQRLGRLLGKQQLDFFFSSQRECRVNLLGQVVVFAAQTALVLEAGLAQLCQFGFAFPDLLVDRADLAIDLAVMTEGNRFG